MFYAKRYLCFYQQPFNWKSFISLRKPKKKKFTGYNLYDFNDASVHILALHISIINMISKRLFSVGNKKINSNYSQKKE